MTTISGKVSAPDEQPLDEPGNGISVGYVLAYDEEGQNTGFAGIEDDGSYSMMVDPGVYTFEIDTYEFPTQWYKAGGNVKDRTGADPVTVVSGENTVSSTLVIGSTISGTIVSPDERSLDRARVFAHGTDGSEAEDQWVASDGTFKLNTWPGQYKLEISADGFPTQWFNDKGNVKDKPDASKINTTDSNQKIDLTLAAGRTIHGTISGSAERPLGSWGWVGAYDTDGGESEGVSFGSDGQYTIGVWPGQYNLEIYSDGRYATQWYKGSGNVKEQADASPIDTTESNQKIDTTLIGTTVSGKIIAPDGEELGYREVSLRNAEGSGEWAEVGADGTYSVGVWPGEYKIWIVGIGVLPYDLAGN